MKKHSKVLIGLVIVIIGVLGFIGYQGSQRTYTISVTEKERVVTSDSSKYLVFGEGEDGEIMVLENSDSFMFTKFNSSDVQGNLKVDGTYKVEVVGWRNGFLSIYPNIIDYEEVEKGGK